MQDAKHRQSECPGSAWYTMCLRVSANEVCLVDLHHVVASVPVAFTETDYLRVPVNWQTEGPWGPGACSMPEAGLGDRVKPGHRRGASPCDPHATGGSMRLS